MKTTFWKCPHHKLIVRLIKKEKEKFSKPIIGSPEEIEILKLIFGCLHPSNKVLSDSIGLCLLPLNYTGFPEICPK